MPTRAEHRKATLLQLGEAATALFEEQGPAATIDAIAKRAGLARRTVFRYVDSKEELAFVHPILWFDVFDAALSEVDDLPLVDKFREASGAIAAYIDADPEPPRQALMLVATHSDLSRGFNGIYQQWVERVATEVLAHNGGTTQADRFHARIVGAAIMGMVDATIREWLMSPPGTTFSHLYKDGFELVAPLVEAASSDT